MTKRILSLSFLSFNAVLTKILDREETSCLVCRTLGNFTLSIEGVKAGILFIELQEGFKVSLRSKGNFPVNKLAAEFGGGGHTNASGIRIRNGKMGDYISKILNKAEEYSERN